MCKVDSGYCVSFIFTLLITAKRTLLSVSDMRLLISWHHHSVIKIAACILINFFSSVPLMTHLSQHGTYACGTVLSNCKGLPDEVKNAKLQQRGDLLQLQKGPLMATVYKDKRQISMLSTSQPPGMTTVDDKATPTVIAGYNKNMGGVDKSDQHRAYYPVGHANKKW